MRNKTFDKIKALACILVILIHCKFPSAFGDVFEALARFGVPMFFAIAGVYLAKASDDTYALRQKLFRKLLRTVKITFKIWVIYTLYSFIYAMSVNYGFDAWFHEKFNLFEFSRLILFNSGKFIYDFTYAFDHMWYLFALIYVYGLCYIFAPFMRILKVPLTVILLAFLYFGEFLQIYYPIRPFGISVSVWYVIRNWLFVGIPFTCLGYMINNDNRIKDIRHPYKISFILTCAGIFMTFIEYLKWGSVEVYFGSTLIVIGLLIAGICSGDKGRLDDQKKEGLLSFTLSFTGKNLSSDIYYYHVMFISLFGYIIDRVYPDAYGNTLFMYFRPIIVITITILISLLLYMVKFITSNLNRNLRK